MHTTDTKTTSSNSSNIKSNSPESKKDNLVLVDKRYNLGVSAYYRILLYMSNQDL